MIKCANCGKREGTIKWVGSEGVLALTHGFYKMWCEICATEAQLEYAKELAKNIPKLEERLKILIAKEEREC